MSETLNFTKLADAPVLESVPDGAKAYAEVDGKVYRVPGDSLGGGGGIKTAIVQLNGVLEAATSSSTQFTGTCQNMTFEEAKAVLMTGQPLAVMLLLDLGPSMGLEAEAPTSWYADGCTYMSNSVFEATPEVIAIRMTMFDIAVTLLWPPDESIISWG